MFKNIVITILVVLVLVVAGFAGYVAMQPDEFSIARSATMSATPEKVFAQVNDFHYWEAWSPWAKLDPKSKVAFDGPSAGKSTIFTWEGNQEVGKGRMTIIESKPNELIRIKLEFFEPFEGTQTAEFTFIPEGEKTIVTWAMSGERDFVQKAFCIAFSMDTMLAVKFDEGLASMKTIVESKKQ